MADYYDILNRKKTGDKLSDAFNKQADSMRPMNVGQRREQALLRGLGVGLSYDGEREALLDEMEQQYKQMDGLERQLKMSTANNQLKEQKMKSFIVDQDANLKLASDLIVKGKYDQLDILAPSIFNAFKEHTGTDLGNYLFSKNGHISFKTPDGKIETMEAKTLFNPIMKYIPPEDRGNYKGFATSYQAEELDAIVETRRLKNELLQAQTDNAKAHSELYKAQGVKTMKEAENPMGGEQEKLTLQTNIKSNRKYIENEIIPKLEANINVLSAYDRLGKIATDTPNLVGSDYLTKFRRTVGEIFGLDPELDYAKLSSVEFEKMLKPILGAQLGKDEGDRVLSKFPSIERNVKALKQFLREERPKLIKTIIKQKAMQNAYNKNNAINILDENNLGDLNSEYKKYLSDRYDHDELLVDTNSKEYNFYKNKGAVVE